MTNENLRMQFLSGVITESEYKVKLQENAAPIFDVVTMDEKTMVGTHQYGVGFKANKKGIEMGFKDDPKSIPNKTKMVKNKSLNESMIGGIVGIGAINQIPPRAKADYETAFEHFLGEKYGLNEVENMEEDLNEADIASIKDINDKIQNDPEFLKKTKEAMAKAEKGDTTDLASLMAGFGKMFEAEKVEEPTNY